MVCHGLPVAVDCGYDLLLLPIPFQPQCMGSRDQLERRLPGKPGEQLRVAVERGAAAQEQEWWAVGKGHRRETLPALQRCPPNGLPVLRQLVFIVTIAGR